MQDVHEFKKEVADKMLTYIGAGLGVVVGLAWNDAISAFIKWVLPLNADSLLAKFIYAIIVTIVIVLLLRQASKIFSRLK